MTIERATKVSYWAKVCRRRSRDQPLYKVGKTGGGWERVDGEHKVDVGWLKEQVDVQRQKGDDWS